MLHYKVYMLGNCYPTYIVTQHIYHPTYVPRHIVNPDKPVDFYTDGSCVDNGRPWAAAGWGVFVHNSAALGEHYGAISTGQYPNQQQYGVGDFGGGWLEQRGAGNGGAPIWLALALGVSGTEAPPWGHFMTKLLTSAT